jgi:hypothetical protein
MDENRPFPIQGEWNWGKGKRHRPVIHNKPCTIPWWLAEQAYYVYSKKFGSSQSLERLAERGGFGRNELIWLLSELVSEHGDINGKRWIEGKWESEG